MTLLAGIFSRRNKASVPDSTCEALNRVISRNPDDHVSFFKDSRSYLVKVDIGVFGEPAFRIDSNGRVSALVGEPLIALSTEDDHWQSRSRDLDLFHESFQQDDWHILTRVQGVFCAVHYDSAVSKLCLIADKLCIRPLYYWASDKYVVFASALRILESLMEIPKNMDVRAVTEIVGLGAPIGSRTPYDNIFHLKPAEIVQFTEKTISRWKYWRWDEIAISNDSEQKLLRKVYGRFTKAIGRRIRGDTTTVAYLSGGLDSRCIVAALRSLGVQVHTFNFALTRTQDQFFGAEFARQASTIHEEVAMEAAADSDWSPIMANAWSASKNRIKSPVERGGLVWSGFGGGEELGQGNIWRELIDLLRSGQTDAAIQLSLAVNRYGIPRRLFTEDVFDAISQILKLGIREELVDIHCEDPGQSFSLFQMMKRRLHFFNHFEGIDLHRLELQLPFLDSALLESIVMIPIDLRLGHNFYTKLLNLFAPVVTSAPWQTYPGHEPCPVLAPQGLFYQWDSVYQTSLRKLRKRAVVGKAVRLLKMNHFPDKILRRRYLQLATLIHGLGLRDYEYVIEAAKIYCRYWAICQGNYVLPAKVQKH